MQLFLWLMLPLVLLKLAWMVKEEKVLARLKSMLSLLEALVLNSLLSQSTRWMLLGTQKKGLMLSNYNSVVSCGHATSETQLLPGFLLVL
uniref:Uncharacterized protein n=1 Tax=Arundo donax TaxID=35708 RepID=A0A0A9FNX2_ARUDO